MIERLVAQRHHSQSGYKEKKKKRRRMSFFACWNDFFLNPCVAMEMRFSWPCYSVAPHTHTHTCSCTERVRKSSLTPNPDQLSSRLSLALCVIRCEVCTEVAVCTPQKVCRCCYKYSTSMYSTRGRNVPANFVRCYRGVAKPKTFNRLESLVSDVFFFFLADEFLTHQGTSSH